MLDRSLKFLRSRIVLIVRVTGNLVGIVLGRITMRGCNGSKTDEGMKVTESTELRPKMRPRSSISTHAENYPRATYSRVIAVKKSRSRDWPIVFSSYPKQDLSILHLLLEDVFYDLFSVSRVMESTAGFTRWFAARCLASVKCTSVQLCTRIIITTIILDMYVCAP